MPNDEIGELARAFERVQGTAAGLVERQVAGRRNVAADVRAYVGRRTQEPGSPARSRSSTASEREETDPEAADP